MSSPGNSVCSCCCERRDAGSTTTSYCSRSVGAPDDQADRARRLAVDQHLARLHDHGVGDRGIRDGDARDVEVGGQHRRSAGGQLNPLEVPGFSAGCCAADAGRTTTTHSAARPTRDTERKG